KVARLRAENYGYALNCWRSSGPSFGKFDLLMQNGTLRFKHKTYEPNVMPFDDKSVKIDDYEVFEVVMKETMKNEVKKGTSTLSTHEWKDLYKKLTKLVNFMAEERIVGWLDTDDQTYWKTEEDLSSEYGKVIHLNYVWWFDIFSKFRCVQPGTYNVLWKIKVDKSFYGLDDVKFTVTTYQENSESIILSEESCVIGHDTFKDIAEINDWVEYHVPIRAIDIPEGGIDEWYDVECKIHEDRIRKINVSTKADSLYASTIFTPPCSPHLPPVLQEYECTVCKVSYRTKEHFSQSGKQTISFPCLESLFFEVFREHIHHHYNHRSGSYKFFNNSQQTFIMLFDARAEVEANKEDIFDLSGK
ncbi:11550_t:CDS:2, partial [Diversispora eburnea]